MGWAKCIKTHFQHKKLYSAIESARRSHSYFLGDVINRLYSLVSFEIEGIFKNYFLFKSQAISK